MTDAVAWMDGQGNLYRYPDDADRGQTMRPLFFAQSNMNSPERRFHFDTDEKELLGKRMHELLNPPPVQREWVGLTLEDMQDLNASKDWIAGAKWAATLLWEKNNAKT